MITGSQPLYTAVVVGAGPAGLYAARTLAQGGVQVAILNRDIKPGGLAEYGIYYDKCKMKDGLRKQFRQILETPGIDYFGNVTVGEQGDLTLQELQSLGFQAVMVTVGAQGTKWLGLPGEDLKGVYHAKDIVYHYNKLPPYSTQEFFVHGRVALVGVGNVMIDIAHWASRDLKVDEIIVVARRGPAEVKFTRKEMEYIIGNLDHAALDWEIARVAPYMWKIGQDVQAARENILAALPKALTPISNTRIRFVFLASPTRMIGDDQGGVTGLEVENNLLVMKNEEVKARSLGTKQILDVDSVVFCIGDRVDENFGLPTQWSEYVKNSHPAFPVDGISYEVFDPDANQPLPGVFVSGWSRSASSGLVGVARKDGENGAKATLLYLHTQPMADNPDQILTSLKDRLQKAQKVVVTKEDVFTLDEAEQEEALLLGVEEHKWKTNEEMLAAIGKGLITTKA